MARSVVLFCPQPLVVQHFAGALQTGRVLFGGLRRRGTRRYLLLTARGFTSGHQVDTSQADQQQYKGPQPQNQCSGVEARTIEHEFAVTCHQIFVDIVSRLAIEYLQSNFTPQIIRQTGVRIGQLLVLAFQAPVFLE